MSGHTHAGMYLHVRGDTHNQQRPRAWQSGETTALDAGGSSTLFFESPAAMVAWLDDARRQAVALVQSTAVPS